MATTSPSAAPLAVVAAPRTAFEIVALLAIVALGVYVRVDDIAAWREQAALAFHDGLPLLLNLDGYFFVSLARDLLQDAYVPVDELRAAPMGDARPVVPPLLSVTSAGLVLLTGAPLEWVVVMLPALLGPLAAVPVYAIARRLEGPAAGLAAALITVLSHSYVFRSNAGFHDTDCLNLTLVMAMAWWSMALARAQRGRFALWLVLGVALYITFLWWWTGAHSVVTAIAGWCLLCALCSHQRSTRERALAAGLCAALAVAAVAWRGAELPLQLAQRLKDIFRHVSKAEQGDFPNVAISIGEQEPATLAYMAERTIGDPILLAVATLGLVWLLADHRRVCAALLAPLALAVLSVAFAERFLIFVAPMTALGVGMLASRALRAGGHLHSMRAVVLIGVLAAAGPSFARSTGVVFMPAASSELVSGMRWLADNSPENALVWAMWDFGYTLRYFSQRATVNDGSVHTGELTVYNAIPFAAPTFREAANFMQFYSVHGAPGMRRVFDAAGGTADGLDLARRVFAAGPHRALQLLAAERLPAFDRISGPGPWQRFLFPADAPPLYLLNDQRMLRTARWWYWFGSYDPATRDGHSVQLEPFYGLRRSAETIRGPGVTVDLARGLATLADGRGIALSRALLNAGGRLEQRRYGDAEGPEFHFFPAQGFGVLQDRQLARSVFSNSFVLKLSVSRYFRPAIPQWSGTFQVWKVTGDRLPPLKGG
jgi:hypothetical protein